MSCNLFNLSTELLIHIFSYLPVTDLFSVQRTCRRVYDIVAETAYLQYILHTHLNCVDDILPPNCSFAERLELLRHHERAWNGLQFNLHSEFSTNVKPYFRKNIIQDGYLISRSNTDLTQYGYVDLFSSPPKEEPRWVHITLTNFLAPYNLVFFVDHDLAVVVRLGSLFITLALLISDREKGTYNRLVLPELAFFEFTTGAPHPLSAAHTISIPLVDYIGSVRVEVEIIGDHILATAVHQDGRSSFYLVSWKTGTATFVGALYFCLNNIWN